MRAYFLAFVVGCVYAACAGKVSDGKARTGTVEAGSDGGPSDTGGRADASSDSGGAPPSMCSPVPFHYDGKQKTKTVDGCERVVLSLPPRVDDDHRCYRPFPPGADATVQYDSAWIHIYSSAYRNTAHADFSRVYTHLMPSHTRNMPTSFTGRRILVVDRLRNMRETIAMILRSKEYDASTAEDASTAWKMLHEEVCFDVLLTSLIGLEPFNGFELIRRVMGDFPRVEVVAMSSSSTPEVELEALRLGAREFLWKPFTEDQLLIRVDRALEFRSLRERALGPGAPRAPRTSISFRPE